MQVTSYIIAYLRSVKQSRWQVAEFVHKLHLSYAFCLNFRPLDLYTAPLLSMSNSSTNIRLLFRQQARHNVHLLIAQFVCQIEFLREVEQPLMQIGRIVLPNNCYILSVEAAVLNERGVIVLCEEPSTFMMVSLTEIRHAMVSTSHCGLTTM